MDKKWWTSLECVKKYLNDSQIECSNEGCICYYSYKYYEYLNGCDCRSNTSWNVLIYIKFILKI